MPTWKMMVLAASMVASFTTGSLYGRKAVQLQWIEAETELRAKHASMMADMAVKQSELNRDLRAIIDERDAQKESLEDARNRIANGTSSMYTYGTCTGVSDDSDTRNILERKPVKLDTNDGLIVLDIRERYLKQLAELRQCKVIIDALR